MSLALKLKNKDLNWLAKGFENHSMISPFNFSADENFNQSDLERLQKIGIINEANEIQPNYYPVLNILSKANSYKEMTFFRGPISANKRIYAYEDKQLSMTYKGEEMHIQMPAKSKAMINYLKEYLGGSTLTSVDLSLEIDAEVAFVFSVIIDIYRKSVFQALAEEAVFEYNGFSINEVIEQANVTRKNSQNLSYHVFILNSGFDTLSSESVENALKTLMDYELIKKKDSLYFPMGEGLLFAGNFLVIENIIECIIGELKSDELYRSNFLILQAGPLDLVYLEKSQENIIIQNMSAMDALAFLTTVLSDPAQIT